MLIRRGDRELFAYTSRSARLGRTGHLHADLSGPRPATWPSAPSSFADPRHDELLQLRGRPAPTCAAPPRSAPVARCAETRRPTCHRRTPGARPTASGFTAIHAVPGVPRRYQGAGHQRRRHATSFSCIAAVRMSETSCCCNCMPARTLPPSTARLRCRIRANTSATAKWPSCAAASTSTDQNPGPATATTRAAEAKNGAIIRSIWATRTSPGPLRRTGQRLHPRGYFSRRQLPPPCFFPAPSWTESCQTTTLPR